MRLPDERVYIAFNCVPINGLAALCETPNVISRIELNRCVFEHLEPEVLNFPYKYCRSQLRELLRRLFDPGIPNLQYLGASLLDVFQRSVVAKRVTRVVASGNQAHPGVGQFALNCLSRPTDIA